MYARLKHSTQGGHRKPQNQVVTATTGRACRECSLAHLPLALGSQQGLLHGPQLLLQGMNQLMEPVLAICSKF